LRVTQRLAGVGAWDWNPASDAFVVSADAAAILGFPGETHLKFGDVLARVHIDDRAAVEQAFRTCAETGHPIEVLWRQTGANGAIRHIAAQGECGGAGAADACRGALSDVSDRIRAEAAMRQNLTMLEAFIADAPALIHFRDINGHIKLVNKAYTDFTGRLKEDVIGSPNSYFPTEIAARFAADRKAASDQQAVIIHEFQVPRGDGELRWLSAAEYRVIAAGELLGTGVVATDVTERRRAEQDLQSLFNRSLALWAVMDIDGRILRVNAGWTDSVYYSPAELIGKRLEGLVEETQRDSFRDILAAVAGGEECGDLELRLVAKEGSVHWLLCNLARTEAGDAISFNAQDITLRKWSEESVRRSETMFSAVINNLPATIYVRDAGGQYILANREFERRHQLPAGGAIGLTPRDLFPDENAARFLNDDRRVMESGQASVEEKDIPFAAGRMTVLSAKFPVAGPDGRTVAIGVVSTDITERKMAEQALARSEAMVSAVINNLPATVCVRDVAGRYILANREFERRHKLPPGGAIGLTPDDLYPEHIADAFLEEDRAVLDSGQTSLKEKDIPFAVGTMTILSAKFPIAGPDGRISAIGVVSTDITDRKKSEQAVARSEAMLRTLSANLPAMVYQFMVSPDGRRSFPFVSDRVIGLFGISPEQAMADPHLLFDSVHPDDVPAIEQTTNISLETMSQWICEFRLRDRGHGISWMRGAATPRGLPDGSIVWDGVIADATELKTIQEAMSEARDAAQKANSAKSEFLSRMSHELRTPMNAVLGFGQLLLEYSDPLTERQREYVGHILSGGRHLLELIDDVLDLAKIETGNVAMNIAPVDVGSLVHECLAIASTLVERFGVQIAPPPDFPAPIQVMADRVRFRQVLLNLMSNAIKYNKRGGTLRVECAVAGERVRISVIDTGQGVPPERQAEMFQPFNRLGAERSEVEGTGIGLTIARMLVERMGGTIAFHSVVGQGSTFWIELPLTQAAVAAAIQDAPVAPPTQEGALNVLYVEDNAANMALITAVLGHGGFKVRTATTGELGLAQALDDPPDVILLDINLPGMDGFAVLAALRGAPATAATTIIAVSAAALPSDLARARAAGFDDYIVKPISVAKLGPAIRAAWRARRALVAADA
jgi:PAS domain S-box-containing protein